MHKCPYCDQKTISFQEKLYELTSSSDKCSHCYGEWTVSKLKYVWIALPLALWIASVLMNFSFIVIIFVLIIYVVGVTFLAPIEKVH